MARPLIGVSGLDAIEEDMGCFEDFIEFREAMERIDMVRRKELDIAARDKCPQQSQPERRIGSEGKIPE